MNQENKFVKIVVFVPVAHANKIREVLGKNMGKIGNYSFCSFSTKGTGRFLPLSDARPTVGEVGKLTVAEEERIEILCLRDNLQKVITEIKEAHPYKEPAINAYAVEVF